MDTGWTDDGIPCSPAAPETGFKLVYWDIIYIPMWMVTGFVIAPAWVGAGFDVNYKRLPPFTLCKRFVKFT